MNSLLKIIRIAMAAVGVILIFGGAGTSDYYVMELGQSEPARVWTLMLVGCVLIVPTIIHAIIEELKERNDEDFM